MSPSTSPPDFWQRWHDGYDDPDSRLAKRLVVVRRYLTTALHELPPGPVRVISLCAGDGRDLLGLINEHPRGADISGRLVELDPVLAERARAEAPEGIEVVCGDAGSSDAYLGATPADLVLCNGVFGNITPESIQTTIGAWRMLCAPGAFVIWTRGGSAPDLRDDVRRWVVEAGFTEVDFEGAPATYGVGLARMAGKAEPFEAGCRLFTFWSQRSPAPPGS